MVLQALRADEVLVLHQDEQSGDVEVQQMSEAPELMTGSELYERFFGLQRTLPKEACKKAGLVPDATTTSGVLRYLPRQSLPDTS